MLKPATNILAFIPARGGSQRLPGKNCKLLAGKPLIAWTIQAALLADLGMDVVVSTDDQNIAEIARDYGAEVPFMRPPELAGNNEPAFTALAYTLEQLAQQGRHYQYLIFLQPTSPLRQAWHIQEAWQLLQQDGVRAVISVAELEHPVQWIMELPHDHRLDDFVVAQTRELKARSQDLHKSYRLNGALYCGRIEDVLQNKSFYLPQGSFAYVMDKAYSVDVDDQFDFEYAEFLIAKQYPQKT